MMSNKLYTLLLAAATLCLAACMADDDSGCPVDAVADTGDNGTRLALSVAGGDGYATRMENTITQEEGKPFRGIDDLYVIPFNVRNRKITPTDERLIDYVEIEHQIGSDGLIANNNARYYLFANVPRRTSAFLVYAHAPATKSTITDKLANGSLIYDVEAISGSEAPASITFAPDPIYTNRTGDNPAVPQVAQSIADFLTGIAKATSNLTAYYRTGNGYNARWYTYNISDKWSETAESTLKGLFTQFTYDGQTFSGSSTAIEKLLTSLYRSLLAYSSNNTNYYNYGNNNLYLAQNTNTRVRYSHLYEAIKNAIIEKINNSSYVSIANSNNSTNATVTLSFAYSNYPSSLGLPDGAAGIRWNSTAEEFEVVNQTTTESQIMAIDRFCYPAELWYTANSLINTSSADDERDHYVPTYLTWQSILDEYAEKKSVVTSSTKSVAIIDQLQYGVANLGVKVKKSSNTLQDANNSNVSNTDFPLTGIIVGNQRQVGFDFLPFPTDDYCAYDPNPVNISNNQQITLSTTLSGPTSTMVLPTLKDEKVYIILEFLNNSGQNFMGANGTIVNGSHFYMTTSVTPNSGATYNPDDDQWNRVFAPDQKTILEVTVKSLKDAWNIIPDMRNDRIELGVSLETKWIQATTTTVPMY